MKKAISFLAVLALALSFCIVGFADPDAEVNVIPNGDAGNLQSPAPYAANDFMPLLMPPMVNGNDLVYTIRPGELFLVDEGNNIVAPDAWLIPGTDYAFDIYYNANPPVVAAANDISGTNSEILGNNDIKKLTYGDLMKNASLKLSVRNSGPLTSSKIRTVGASTNVNSTYRLELTTRQNYGVRMSEVEVTLSVSGAHAVQIPDFVFADSTYNFRVGYNTIDDADTDVGEDGTLIISNDYPVILKDQFTDIAKSANYKNVNFEAEDGSWSFTGKVSGMKDTNFIYNEDPDEDLLNKFPDQDFKFLNFPGGVNFPTTGEMRINVSDVSDDFSNMYVYLYRDGKLTQINGTYDSGADEVVFRTNYLGRFVITNNEITNTSLIPDTDHGTSPEEIGTNPSTGIATGVNLTAVMALTALGGGILIRRKRTK